MKQAQTMPLLPKGVRIESGRYVHFRKVNGATKRTSLTRVEDGEQALHDELSRHGLVEIRTVKDLLFDYLLNGTGDIEPITRHGYTGQVNAKLVPFFGKMLVRNVQPKHVASFLEIERKAGTAVSANRARAVLSSAFVHGMRNGCAEFNPCYGVRRNKERPSRRYVENTELDAALDSSADYFAVLMETAYLTGLRQIDLIKLKRAQLKGNGIEITESKTSKPRLMLWTEALRAAIDKAIALGDAQIERRSKRRKQQYALPEQVFVNSRAQPWTPGAVCQAMDRYNASFTFRQLRPKAASDAEHNVLGHTGQMLARYVRREKLTPVK